MTTSTSISITTQNDVVTAKFGPTLTYSPPAGYNSGLYTAGSSATAAPLKTPGKIGQAIKFDGLTASTTVGNVS